MKSALRPLAHPGQAHPGRHAAPSVTARDRPGVDGHPAPGEVLAEIGLLLAIHLAVAFAIALTLRVLGIA